MAPQKRRQPPPPSAGTRLVAELSKADDPYAITILIVEAGRLATRLEKLDALLTGDADAWLRLRINGDQTVEVKVDGALAEARQSATVLRHLLAEVHRQRALIPLLGEDDSDDLAGI
jgi:hypothetical protein